MYASGGVGHNRDSSTGFSRCCNKPRHCRADGLLASLDVPRHRSIGKGCGVPQTAADECEPRYVAKLKIKVVQVLQGSSDGLGAGQVLDANTHVCSAPPILVGKAWYEVCGLGDRDVTVRRDNEPVSDADVAKVFNGRSFWFARWQNGDVITYTRPGDALDMWKNACPTSPYRLH